MRKSKKILSSIIIGCLLIGGTTAVQATLLTNTSIPLNPVNGYSRINGNYVTTVQSGTMKEEHSLQSGGKIYAFKAVLEERTAWYTPNNPRDTSVSINGWNAAYEVSEEQDFRTVFEANNDVTSIENTSYSNY